MNTTAFSRVQCVHVFLEHRRAYQDIPNRDAELASADKVAGRLHELANQVQSRDFLTPEAEMVAENFLTEEGAVEYERIFESVPDSEQTVHAGMHVMYLELSMYETYGNNREVISRIMGRDMPATMGDYIADKNRYLREQHGARVDIFEVPKKFAPRRAQ